jgi:DNA polymerase-3 subunit delta'
MFERLAQEQHDTLEGIPEPAENPLLFGQADAKSMLVGALRAGKMPHALIFAGPQGIGKATLAFHLANLLLKNPDPASVIDIGAPEPASSTFRQVASGAHPSVLYLTRPVNERTKGFKTVVTVDEIRKVNRFLSMTAHDGGWRVVIVDPADDMNTNAANALLKNLEEPPAKTVFVLVVHSIGSLLPTIRSRSQTVRFTPLADEDLRQALGSFEDMAVAGGPELDALVRRAGGSVRNAILLSQYGGLEIADAVDEVAGMQALDIARAHKLADAVSGRDRAVPFEMFNERALEILADAAATAAAAGQLARANALSRAWQEARIAISETETYNLDQKQHALTMINRLNAVMRSTGAQSSGRM